VRAADQVEQLEASLVGGAPKKRGSVPRDQHQE
jgi:hypothetical protein